VIRFVDLFAGIGGFHHALSDGPINGQCVMAVEIDEKCRTVYENTFLNKSILSDTFPFIGDLRTLTRDEEGKRDRPLKELDQLVPDHDLLCGGFPCQPFSKSGKQQGTLDETRGTLFFDIMRIIKAKQPKYVMLENVPNLVGPNHFEDTWMVIVEKLRAAGYLVSSTPAILSPHFLSPSMGGTPQVRNRLFILATRKDQPGIPQPKRTVRDYLDEVGRFDPTAWNIENYLMGETADSTHKLREEELMWLNAWQYFIKMIPSDELPGFPIWEESLKPRVSLPDNCPEWKAEFLFSNRNFYLAHRKVIDDWRKIDWSNGKGPSPITISDFPTSRRKFEWQARRAQPTRSDRDLFKLLIQLRPSGIRVKPANYAPALVAINQTSIVGSKKRRITPQEAALLQGFPPTIFDDVEIGSQAMYKQLGNAVPVGLVKFCADWLINRDGNISQ